MANLSLLFPFQPYTYSGAVISNHRRVLTFTYQVPFFSVFAKPFTLSFLTSVAVVRFEIWVRVLGLRFSDFKALRLGL